MTAIAGVVHNGKVWIGGDSAGVSGWQITTRADEKVFVKEPMVFGFCGSFRAGQLVRHKLAIPKHYEGSDADYLVGPFIDSLRQCMKDGGLGATEHGTEQSRGGFLIGYKGALYSVQGDFQVGQSADTFTAMGAGDELAIGSLATSTGHPKARIEKALGIAAQFSGAVCGPFHIVSGGAA